jgi:hypothetical protein
MIFFHDPSSCSNASYVATGEPVCEWLNNGQGIEYLVLAGPVFVVVFTVSGIVMGLLADKFSRYP